MRTSRTILCAIAVCVLASVSSDAETGGRLHGLVSDEAGRPLPGAHVTVTGPGTAGHQVATADTGGVYKVLGLPLREPLVVRAEAPGKTPVVYSGLMARKGFGTRRDFRLRPPDFRDVLVLMSPRWIYYQEVLDGARQTLRGEITVLELTGGDLADAREVRAALRRMPNAVLAIGRTAASLARREIKDIPVIYLMVPDPRGDDLITANLCGVALNGGFGDQLDQLARLMPEARKIATVYDPRRLGREVRELRALLAGRGMSLEARSARDSRELTSALGALDVTDIDAFLLLLDPDLLDAFALERIRGFVTARDLVYIVPDPSLLDLGGTFSLAPGFEQMGADAGYLANRIVESGLQPARIGLEFPIKRVLALNPSRAGQGSVTAIAKDE